MALQWMDENLLTRTIGYDRDHVESLLYFWADVEGRGVHNEHNIVVRIQKIKSIQSCFTFNSSRDRPWRLFVFNDTFKDIRDLL